MTKTFGLRSNHKTSNTKSNGYLISIEGISGVGKTHFSELLKKELEKKYDVVTVGELSDWTHNDIGKMILDILISTKDKFFRLGYPKTEGFLLLALKNYQLEKYIKPALKQGKVVIEDRGIDTVALYTSILLEIDKSEKDVISTYKDYLKIGQRFGLMPNLTIYLRDDFNKSIKRAEERNRQKYLQDELNILKKADLYYQLIARNNNSRFVIINEQGFNVAEITKKITTVCLDKLSEFYVK